MKYGALTFDTQTVESNGFDFDGKLLAQLKQFAKGSPNVLISEIVVEEVRRHLEAHVLAAKDGLEKAHRDALRYGLKPAADQPFVQPPDPVAVARARLDNYLAEIGAIIIAAKAAPMDEVVRRYHHGLPPFSKGKKKAEFPDAIALLSLELYAKGNKTKILAVSGDGDWKAFGEKSEHIEVVSKLGDALSKLQGDAQKPEEPDKSEEYAARALADIKSGKNPSLAAQFEKLLSEAISSADVTAEGSSAHHFEPDSVEVTLSSYELEDDPEMMGLQIVRAGGGIIVASFDLRVVVDADASFSMSIWDSIDREYVGMGPSYARKEDEEVEVRALVTLEGDFAADRIDVTKVELIEGLDEIDFGEIEIDYGDPYDGEGPDEKEVENNEPDEQAAEPEQEEPM